MKLLTTKKKNLKIQDDLEVKRQKRKEYMEKKKNNPELITKWETLEDHQKKSKRFSQQLPQKRGPPKLPPPPFKKKRKVEIEMPKEWDDEEITFLRNMIMDLPPNKMAGIIEILDVNEDQVETIELDLDGLRKSKLIDLFLYCKKNLQWKRRPAHAQYKKDLLQKELDELNNESRSPEEEEELDDDMMEIDENETPEQEHHFRGSHAGKSFAKESIMNPF